MRAFTPALLVAGGLLLGACSGAPDDAYGEEALTGTSSSERGLHFQSYVQVRDGASDDEIKSAIAREVKTAIGALRAPKVSLGDRGARSNLDPARWTRKTLSVVDPANVAAPPQKILRVTFPYDDRAVVTNTLARRSSIAVTMLADEYAQHALPIKNDCTDDRTTDDDSIWFHYAPAQGACKARITEEQAAIDAEQAKLRSRPDTIGPREANRWFVPVTAKLDPPKTPAQAYSPEYDRLFGVGTDKTDLVVYAFFGVDTDEASPDDLLGVEAAKFLRTMLRAQPRFQPSKTEPFTMLLDFFVDGRKVDGVTYDRMLGWIIDRSGYPAEVGTDASKILELRRQAIAKLAERWIYWDLPMQVAAPGGQAKSVKVHVRSFYGYEDGSPEARQKAQWRYLEAMWHGDVFLYNGHSHFGHGPLEPTLYGRQNFDDRYQIMMVNSCVSFNYYHQDFLEMKPGGSANLDMIVNGLPSYVLDGGVATARLLTGILDGRQRPYKDLLDSMKLDYPWGERGYDPMRVVDGELDNRFSQARTPLTITPAP